MKNALKNKFWVAGKGKDFMMGGNLDKAKNLKIQDPLRGWTAKELREAIKRSSSIIDLEMDSVERYEQELSRRDT